MTLPIRVVRAEFARRAVQFHKGEELEKIRLWGLFSWDAVSRYLKDGRVLTDMRKENRTIWCVPSQEEIDKHIRPMVEKHTLEELTQLAGW